jgi:hypothetical protein
VKGVSPPLKFPVTAKGSVCRCVSSFSALPRVARATGIRKKIHDIAK